MMMSFFLDLGAALSSPSAAPSSFLSAMKNLLGSSVGNASTRARTLAPNVRPPHRETRVAMVNDCLPSGKILPGHNDLAALSALPPVPVFLAKQLINHPF
jgi:hypothetical protein